MNKKEQPAYDPNEKVPQDMICYNRHDRRHKIKVKKQRMKVAKPVI